MNNAPHLATSANGSAATAVAGTVAAAHVTPAQRIALMLPWLLWTAFVIVVDQITKSWILQNYQLGEGTPVTGFFNIVRAHNTGAAFSFLAGGDGWQRWLFVGIAIAATVFIFWQLYRHPGHRLMAFALSGILGGAIGNVADRLMHGYVVDFLDFYWSGQHFPAFNVADSAITLGAICLVLDELLRMRRARKLTSA